MRMPIMLTLQYTALHALRY